MIQETSDIVITLINYLISAMLQLKIDTPKLRLEVSFFNGNVASVSIDNVVHIKETIKQDCPS